MFIEKDVLFLCAHIDNLIDIEIELWSLCFACIIYVGITGVRHYARGSKRMVKVCYEQ